MNILEAYILQKKFLTIVISCLDTIKLKEISRNLANDLHAELIDLTDKMNNISSLDEIDIDQINSLDSNSTIKIIASPIYPDNFFKFRINYHINLSLNNHLINEANIDKNLVELNEKVVKATRINKFFNMSKFKSNSEIEDSLFNLIMDFISYKLDNGGYLDRVKKQKNSEDKDPNEKIDNQIMEEIEIDTDEPLIDVANEIKADDVNMDKDMIPTKIISDYDNFHDLHEVKQYGGIDKNKIIEDLTESVSEYLYSKIINNKEVVGRRMLKKKIVFKKNEI